MRFLRKNCGDFPYFLRKNCGPKMETFFHHSMGMLGVALGVGFTLVLEVAFTLVLEVAFGEP